MVDPTNGPPVAGGPSLLLGGSEFTVLVTFQLPVVCVSMASVTMPASTTVLSVSSSALSISLSASSTGGAGGTLSASFSYTSLASGIFTQVTMAASPVLSMPMLFGGWVTAAFSVSSAGVATLSVRDIFAANNATSGARRQQCVCGRCACLLTRLV